MTTKKKRNGVQQFKHLQFNNNINGPMRDNRFQFQHYLA